MCAIFGIVGDYDPKKARYALKKLTHRGPDDTTFLEKKDLFFAHNLLNIQNNQTKQVIQKDGVVISFNGEIYNLKELQEQLKGYGLSAGDEIEVLYQAYKKWGIDFVQRVRGMFAIALQDQKTLYLLRDRLGKKPIFYLQRDSFVFASEIKALTPFLDKNEMDTDAFLSYLSFLTPTPPHTFFKGIKKLAAGEYLIYKDNKVKTKKYFNILDTKPNTVTDKYEALYLLESKLKESIDIRLNANTPIASLLSGGIDSATINYFSSMSKKNLQTYTLGYMGYEKYDESLEAKKSAEYLGLENKNVEITLEHYNQYLDDVLDSLDEPINDPAAIPLYILFSEIKKDGYRVVLSGEG